MKLKLNQVGEPALRRRARALSKAEIRDTALQQLIEWMRETMRDAPGVGLAAPQIGEALQLAVIEDRSEYMQYIAPETLAERARSPVPFQVIINPRLTVVDNTAIEFFEGCLSLTGYTALVPRARAVRVNCLNEHAESVVINACGWYARILQHEIDHLQGTLYIDRMVSQSFMTTDNYARYWQGDTIEQIHTAMGASLPAK